ncbi:WecB/TagA/CpsF family glycosyltransferase [Geodermatophilus sp. SYSU D00691]
MAFRGEAYLEAKFRFHPSWRQAVEHVRQLCDSGQYDLAVTSQWPGLLMALDAGLRPDLHIAHNVDTVIARRYDPLPLRVLRNAARTERSERRLLARAQHLAALSRADVARMEEWGLKADQVRLWRGSQVRPTRSVSRHRVGFIGSMGWPPNRSAFHTLVDEVLPEVQRLDPALYDRIEVVVAGRASEGLAGQKVRALGVVNDLSDFYRAVDLVVVPRTGPSTGISVKLLEALEHGVDVVGPGALFDDAGLAAEGWRGETASEMAACIVDFYAGTSCKSHQPDGSVATSTGIEEILSTIVDEGHEAVSTESRSAAMRDRFVHSEAELETLAFSGQRPLRVQTVNLQHLHLASVHPDFRNAMRAADRLTADGWPVQLLLRKRGVRVARVTGSGFVRAVVMSGALKGRRLAMLGSSTATGDRFQSVVESAGGRLVLRDHGRWREWDIDLIARRLADAKVDVVLVAVTPPAGELVAHRLRTSGLNACVLGVGGAIDMLTGVRRTAPSLVSRLGLEWLFRFAQEPRRLFRRYFLEGVPLLARLIVTGRMPGIDREVA